MGTRTTRTTTPGRMPRLGQPAPRTRSTAMSPARTGTAIPHPISSTWRPKAEGPVPERHERAGEVIVGKQSARAESSPTPDGPSIQGSQQRGAQEGIRGKDESSPGGTRTAAKHDRQVRRRVTTIRPGRADAQGWGPLATRRRKPTPHSGTYSGARPRPETTGRSRRP